MSNKKAFGDLAKEVRYGLELTQETMAAKLHICVRHLAAIEKGEDAPSFPLCMNYFVLASEQSRNKLQKALVFDTEHPKRVLSPTPAMELCRL